ncbi:MAG: hypothetical protein WC279_15025 [Sulfurimonas sp.]|jgi:hypothetical protein|uniref:hypothetical protein n=1 Tax=unclassified Sulfurimonas TaxID=2623549 RepID=UPI0008BA1D02|nr:hypothetical protein [Sulfurimonas sp. RIFOXYB12_FULL_35_9]MBS4067804.1 hypothetical protein [Sulfurimonas sp.]MDX9757141.1 hypothetical protein [Sulfurimonas sp.]OHE05070.1 MAG: hypothetical protein A2345_06905 [Sulfurimonas sp. RIFOXYB12_FULL_35_9]
MYSVNINIDNSELENFIQMKYGDKKNSLVSDIVSYLETESHIYKIKKAFDEVEDYKAGKIKLTSAEDFLKELRSEN